MSRARQAAEPLELKRYRVRRWTAFEWPNDDPRDEDRRAAREKALVRSGDQFERRLRRIAPDCLASVKQVRRERKPQLMFELTLFAPSEEAVKAKARYYIKRALSVKVRAADGKRVEVVPPWGRTEVEEIKEARKTRVAAPVAD